MNNEEGLRNAEGPSTSVASPHICIVDELEGLEMAVCKINALLDRVLGNPSDFSDNGISAKTISLNDFLHDTPDRLVKITENIENYVADIEKTLFS